MRHLSGLFNIEPIYIELIKPDIDKLKTNEEVFQESYDALESIFIYLFYLFVLKNKDLFLEQFKYTALETDNTEDDIDEEEGENEDEEGEEEAEEEEMDLFKRDRKKHLGDTNIYDPVALFDKNILLPGKADVILSYNSKIYRFANEDNRTIFLQTPLKYLPINKSPNLPSLRLIFIGAEGTGKSLHGRELAKKYNTFHIKFRDRLQELIISKTKMKIGHEYNESRDEFDA